MPVDSTFGQAVYGNDAYGSNGVAAALAAGNQGKPGGERHKDLPAMLRKRARFRDVPDPLLAELVRGY